jgi:hypothetical protein
MGQKTRRQKELSRGGNNPAECGEADATSSAATSRAGSHDKLRAHGGGAQGGGQVSQGSSSSSSSTQADPAPSLVDPSAPRSVSRVATGLQIFAAGVLVSGLCIAAWEVLGGALALDGGAQKPCPSFGNATPGLHSIIAGAEVTSFPRSFGRGSRTAGVDVAGGDLVSLPLGLADADRSAVCGGAPMQSGAHFGEFTIIRSRGHMVVGVARDGFDPAAGRASATQSDAGWGVIVGSGHVSVGAELGGRAVHRGDIRHWAGQVAAAEGDTLGLMVDPARGILTGFLNGRRLGVIFERGVVGKLRWVVELYHAGDAVRFAASSPSMQRQARQPTPKDHASATYAHARDHGKATVEGAASLLHPSLRHVNTHNWGFSMCDVLARRWR